MFLIEGEYNSAVVFTDNLESKAIDQIRTLCDQQFAAGSKIRIMPDAHSGAGCTIGTTMTITDKVVPNLVGVDIGCGMEVVKLATSEIDLPALDSFIHARIPCGFSVRDKEHDFIRKIDIDALVCRDRVDMKRARRSIGTLGGGNHFIEVNQDNAGGLYLVVHSGSRHLGNEVAQLYQAEAFRAMNQSEKSESLTAVPKALAYASGMLFDDYIHDMKIIQHYADLNRKAMVHDIMLALGLMEIERFTTIHNYIDMERMILRKGAVSALKGEKLLVPINMRDGSLICIGKGNPEWNYSAPHGAGRLMSRTAARKSLSLAEYIHLMQGIYTTTANKETLDESPLAYKPLAEIVANIKDTAEIVERIIPIYNFKAAE